MLNYQLRPVILCFFLLLLFTGCSEKKGIDRSKVLKLALSTYPYTLDPRKCVDIPSKNLIKMIFEGLYRIDGKGALCPGLCSCVDISKDKKRYTFHLREASWSDGKTISAYDFESTWKKTLSPDFPSPFAFKLFVIKNAKKAKEGKISLDEVGIKARDSKTLIVELEFACSYFLQLTTQSCFLPLPKEEINLLVQEKSIISSGPFILESSRLASAISMKKNDHYWDAKNVKLERISLSIIDNENTSHILFENGELDFLGYPFTEIPLDAMDSLGKKIKNSPFNNLFFLDLNTNRFPFHNENIRKAFGYSVERASLIKEIGHGIPKLATSFTPYYPKDFFTSCDIQRAKQYLEKGLLELNVSKNDLDITLIYNNREYNHKICQTIKHQWKKNLGIDVKLQSQHFASYIHNFSLQNYQIAKVTWFADFTDSIAFFHLFGINSNVLEKRRWNNGEFMNLLNSSTRIIGKQRKKLLEEAEKLLLTNMVVIPIHDSFYPYLKSPRLRNITFCQNGEIDFKWSYFNHD